MHGERRSSQIGQDTSHKTLEPYSPLSKTYAQDSGCNHQAVQELRKAGLMPPLRPRRKPRR